MTLYVVRHGKAGSRSAWTGPDDLRPLTKAGRRQAMMLGEALATVPVRQVLSSPYVRCRQTVEPLAERLRLPVDLSDALEEGAPPAETLALLDKIGDDDAVLCTHGDVLGEVLAQSVRHGVRVETDLLQKGSTWVFETDGGEIVDARYVPPSAT